MSIRRGVLPPTAGRSSQPVYSRRRGNWNAFCFCLGHSEPIVSFFIVWRVLEGGKVRPQILLAISVACGFLVWGIVTSQYVWLALRSRPFLDARADRAIETIAVPATFV